MLGCSLSLSSGKVEKWKLVEFHLAPGPVWGETQSVTRSDALERKPDVLQQGRLQTGQDLRARNYLHENACLADCEGGPPYDRFCPKLQNSLFGELKLLLSTELLKLQAASSSNTLTSLSLASDH